MKYIINNFLIEFVFFSFLKTYYYTGLPTKDETAETTVKNLFFLTFLFPCNCMHVNFFTK